MNHYIDKQVSITPIHIPIHSQSSKVEKLRCVSKHHYQGDEELARAVCHCREAVARLRWTWWTSHQEPMRRSVSANANSCLTALVSVARNRVRGRFSSGRLGRKPNPRPPPPPSP